MKPGFADLFKAAQQTVALCEVQPDENVLVYCDTRQHPTLVEAFHTACVAARADVSLVRTLHRFPETDPPPAAIEAMKAADMVFDLATESWFYAPCTPEILDTAARRTGVGLATIRRIEQTNCEISQPSRGRRTIYRGPK